MKIEGQGFQSEVLAGSRRNDRTPFIHIISMTILTGRGRPLHGSGSIPINDGPVVNYITICTFMEPSCSSQLIIGANK